MNATQQAAARQMLSEPEKVHVAVLLRKVEQLISRDLGLGLSGQEAGAIAALIRATLREEIDATVYYQRSPEIQGTPAI